MDIEEERPNEVTNIDFALKRYKGEVGGKRGPSLFLKKKWKSTRQVIEFDSKNCIKDDVVRVEVETWQGIIAKTRVKLSEYPKWPVVPKEKKQDLWDHFLVSICVLVSSFNILTSISFDINVFMVISFASCG